VHACAVWLLSDWTFVAFAALVTYPNALAPITSAAVPAVEISDLDGLGDFGFRGADGPIGQA
jgi:hypothetical protein